MRLSKYSVRLSKYYVRVSKYSVRGSKLAVQLRYSGVGEYRGLLLIAAL